MEVRSIVGDVGEDRFTHRRCHYLDIGWGDAAKHRQIGCTDTGMQVRIILPRSTFLHDGAVLADDGEQIVVVRRPEEPALAVRFDDNCGADGARRMLLLGYLLGNQHAPIDVGHDRVAAPLFTSESTARRMLAELQITADVRPVAMATHGWSRTSADAHAGHHH
ncbi:urease accessory protein UreE [Mycolicibacterium agri]|uniref:Urease accessory protein UreE n=1 Tax=Mycolicibacterium agri TaxID=36811 RepID=A0A2A7MVQ6_MYCAG|nr:urease accessory protein UreE [Mycolicibacterium agri]PEG35744.1 urease accessory protein UreE [Mycolicibacterium agri]